MSRLLLSASLCAFVLAPTTVQAGVRTYISRSGTDANTCTSPGAPCATFQRGIDVAGAKGEVYCLDSSFFGSMNITFSVNVMCEDYHGQTGVNQIVVTTGANDVVVLNGIDMDHRDSPISSGVNFNGAGTLILRNSSILHPVNGINFAPNGKAKLAIANTNIDANNNAALVIAPTGSASVRVDIDGLKAVANLGGVFVNAVTGTSVQMEIRNSVLSQNSNYGLVNNSSGGVSVVFIENSAISHNENVGIYSTGANAFTLVSRSVITRNQLGWAFAFAGSLFSYGNNVVNNIGGDGGPSATIGLQ